MQVQFKYYTTKYFNGFKQSFLFSIKIILVKNKTKKQSN